MPYHKITIDGAERSFEVFRAYFVSCDKCDSEGVTRHSEYNNIYHKPRCNKLDVVVLDSGGWCYAFGEEGYEWDTEPSTTFQSHDEALRVACLAILDEAHEGEPA
jgi:hypothetical protein